MNSTPPTALVREHLSAIGGVPGMLHGHETILHFGDPSAEYAAATTAAGLAWLPARTRIRLTGDDRVKFLNNLTSNDIKQLPVDQSVEAFFCNAKGHILWFVEVIATADAHVIETVPGQHAALFAHLDRYLIREKVELSDLTGEDGATGGLPTSAPGEGGGGSSTASPAEQFDLVGPAAEAALAGVFGRGALPASPATRQSFTWQEENIELRRAPWFAAPTFVLTVPGARAVPVCQALIAAGAQPIGATVLETLRIENAYPYHGVDIPEGTLPQEVDRNRLAISFTKGCYIGQETVARIDALGHVNKTLRLVRFSSSQAVPAGLEWTAEGKSLGRVTSSIVSPRTGDVLALGYVRRGSNKPGTKLSTEQGDAEVLAGPIG